MSVSAAHTLSSRSIYASHTYIHLSPRSRLTHLCHDKQPHHSSKLVLGDRMLLNIKLELILALSLNPSRAICNRNLPPRVRERPFKSICARFRPGILVPCHHFSARGVIVWLTEWGVRFGPGLLHRATLPAMVRISKNQSSSVPEEALGFQRSGLPAVTAGPDPAGET